MSDKTVDEIERILRAPFSRRNLLWRVGQQGVSANGKAWCMPLCYIDVRAVRQRLVDAVGFTGWTSKHRTVGNGVVCDLSIIIDGEWLTRSDGAGESDIEGEKGSYSGSLKRAAANFGVGEYLYDLDSGFAKIVTASSNVTVDGFVSANSKKNKKKENTNYIWETPELPAFAKLSIKDEITLCKDQEDLMNLWSTLFNNEQDEAKQMFSDARKAFNPTPPTVEERS